MASAAPTARGGGSGDARGDFETLLAQHEQLLRKVSHDLRTPLVAILLQSLILERSLDDRDPNKPRVATIIAMTREFTTLIDRLVETARLEAGITKLQAGDIALPDLIREIVTGDFQSDWDRIDVTAGAELPLMVGDRRRIQLLVRTLLGRATKASNAKIDVELSHLGPEVHLTVRDLGRPVATPGHPSRLERDGCSDDLYLVGLIAAAHGGRAWIESPPDQGNAVTVALPLGRGRATPSEDR
jgi:signal transduction histidine kinase